MSINKKVSAQSSISYFYDDAGNRVERTIVLTTQEKSAKTDTSKKKEAIAENMGNGKILIYPNPTKGQLLVEVTGYDKSAKTGLFLFNLSGALLTSKSPITGSDPLDLSFYPIGTYILKIVLGEKSTEWKIIKE